MRATMKAALVLAIAIAGSASPALAQDPEVHTDPDHGSPAGTLYEIPLERGRADGAPLGAVGSEGASPIRSENGFGSSSHVPGASVDDDGGASGAGGSGGEGGSDGKGAAGGARGSGGAGASGSGNEGASGSGGEPREATTALAASTVTVSRSLLLLALGAAVALMLGLAARWASARR